MTVRQLLLLLLGTLPSCSRQDAAPTAPATAPAVDTAPLALGDLLPDHAFIAANGRAVRLSDFKGQAFAFTFFFTRCPFPDFCPRLSKNLAETQALLQANPDAPDNWHLASITIEPEYDTPERLAAYATEYGADPEHWDFLTAPLAEVSALGARFGLDLWRANPDELLTHNTRTVVIDTEGRVRWIGEGTDWTPGTLAAQIRAAAR